MADQVPNLDEQLAAAVQSELAKQPVTDPTIPAKPSGINLKLGDNTFTFNDENDLNTRIGSYFSQQNTELSQARATLDAQRQELEQLKQTSRKPAEGTTLNDKDEFIQNFAKTFIDDPVAGFEMAFERSKYNKKVNDFGQKVDQLNTNQVAQTFRDTHPDYMATEQNGKALVDIMAHFKLPFTEDNLHLAYIEGLRVGKVTGGQQDSQFSLQPPSRHSVPTIQRNSQAELPPSWLADIENLPAESIAAIIHKFESNK